MLRLRFSSTIALLVAAALAAARGRGGGCGRVWSSGHARAAAETAGCRLGRRRSHRRPRTSAAPSTSSPLIGRHRRGSTVCESLGLGLSVEDGGVVDRSPSWWSTSRPSGLVASPSRNTRICGTWPSALLSRLVFCHGRCMCASMDATPPSSRASLLVSRSLRRPRPGSRATCNRWWRVRAHCWLITRRARGLGVRCALFSVDGGVGCFSWLN